MSAKIRSASMQQLLEIAEDENIAVEYKRFKSDINGMYLQVPDCQPVIYLSLKLHSDYRLHRCVLAEEIGHHFTSAGERTPKKHHSMQDRLSIDKCEYKALRWAANYLIPEHDLIDVISEGLCEIWELAEHFDVTEELMRFRLRLWGIKATEGIL
jgi:Zn-dependent peptidase ImmA (M78 family)